MHMLYAHTGMHTYKHHTFRHAHNAIRVALHAEKASVALSHWFVVGLLIKLEHGYVARFFESRIDHPLPRHCPHGHPRTVTYPHPRHQQRLLLSLGTYLRSIRIRDCR